MQNKHELTKFVDECIVQNKSELLTNLLFKLGSEYIELAQLATDGAYNEQWTHQKVLDYLTYEFRR